MFNKKTISGLLVLMLLLSLYIPINAQEKTDTEKMTTVLKLGLMKGNGTSLDLGSQLKRSEAATLIARLLGVEKVVLENKAEYVKTPFKDVKESAWYAPTIGYCNKEGIINGFPDGTYKPDKYISEKAFLKLVLGVLGYKQGTDYTWETLYKKAYELGIVKESTYQTAAKDNEDYIRKDLINVIYNSLKISKKGTSTTILQSLIDTGFVSIDQARNSGIGYDTLISGIKTVNSQNATTLEILLNEEIAKIGSVKIYEKNNAAQEISASVSSIVKDKAILTTGEQKSGTAYVVVLNNIEDKGGNIVDQLLGEFNGYKVEEITSAYFMVSKVEAISQDVIAVYFTQPINISTGIPFYYDIYEGDKLFVEGSNSTIYTTIIGGKNNGIYIRLTNNKLKEGVKYSLKLTNEVRSALGAKLYGGSAESMSFYGVSNENDTIGLDNYMPLDNRSIVLQFSVDLDRSYAENPGNYSIKTSAGTPVPIFGAKVCGEGDMELRTVKIGVQSTLNQYEIYKMTIKNIWDSTRESSISSQEFEFAGVDTEREDFDIAYVYPDDQGTLSVYFNRPWGSSYAGNKDYYTITSTDDNSYGSWSPEQVYYNESENPDMVRLYLPAGHQLNGAYTYELKINRDLRDHLNIASPDNMSLEFTGTTTSNNGPVPTKALVISDTQVQLEFSKEISSSSPNRDSSNYSLIYYSGDTKKTITTKGANVVQNKSVILTFDSLDMGTEYKIRYNVIKDYSEQGFNGGDNNLVTVQFP